MDTQKKYYFLLAFISLFFAINTMAQYPPATRITPFTGTNYVRVVTAMKPTEPASKYTYKAIIKSINDGKTLYSGMVDTKTYKENGIEYVTFTLNNLSPVLWTPANPHLYELNLQFFENGIVITEKQERIGFRSFESKNGNLYLNGKPIFLRGIAINPPERGIPTEIERSRKFAQDYVRFMKSINVNIIRIPDDETWYDVCDEEGMMVFGGNYGGQVNGEKPPTDYDKGVEWYKTERFMPIAHHPSLMIYAMTNEVPYQGKIATEWENFLSYSYKKLKEWDETRVYIANAGYGYGKSGDICDLHRYWGWYYCSPFTFLFIRNNEDMIPFKKPVQPVTFTECVGNYSGPTGEINLTPAHKNPGSQLNWTGHAAWGEEQRNLSYEHQNFTFKTATELFRRLRVENSELSGVFPFTILFHNWNSIKTFADMAPKPVTQQAKLSYNPILISWENWTTQVYAGATIHPKLHIVNDDDNFSDLTNATFIYQIINEKKLPVIADSFALPSIAYYETFQKKLNIDLPKSLPSGYYQLIGKIVKDNSIISENFDNVFIANATFINVSERSKKQILLFDPSGKTGNALQAQKIFFKNITSFKNIPTTSVLVIGENSANEIFKKSASDMKQYVANGGRILILKQDSLLFNNINSILNCSLKNITTLLDIPKYPPPPRPSRNGYYINPERPEHPVFSGISRENLRVWSDYTNWNESDKKGFPAIYPVTDGFVLANKNDMGKIAVIGNYGVGLESIAIAEIFNGKGSVIVCGLDIINRNKFDPVADKMLINLINYTANKTEHQLYQLITEPIVWGDYKTEKGILTGVNSGLLLNATPQLSGNNVQSNITLTEEGDMFEGASGGFNTRPGIPYIHNGRRPYGPYSLVGFGNVPHPDNVNNNIGEGTFWCRIPTGKTIASTIVWNPYEKSRIITIKVNNKEVSREIKPNEKATVNCPVKSSVIQMTFTGDRRLVLLQTSFE
jgi:hypothetical protein